MSSTDQPASTFHSIVTRVAAAAASAGHPAALLAVSKTKPASAIAELARQGQRAFGENYVQEALAKQRELANPDIEWHLIGPLQSNKARDVATHFDWMHTLDRERLIEPLDRWRPADCAPLNVLIQVNIDDEVSKSGCRIADIADLATRIDAAPNLRLRGLMAIPAPNEDREMRRRAFARMHDQFLQLKSDHAEIDTLSMGMSDDFELAISEGATLVRIGSALFGSRASSPP